MVAVANDGQTDMALLHVDRLRGDELGIEPGRLAVLDRGRLEQRPGAGVLIAELLAFLPVRAVRRRRHPPQRLAVVVDGVVAVALRRHHRRGEGGVPEDLLGDVALAERRQRLVEVVVGSARRRVFPQPLVPLGDGIDRGRAVGLAAARHRGARRVAGTLLHADAPLVDRTAVRQTRRAGAGHRQPRVGHAPAEIGRALAVVHVAIDADAVDFLHVVGEEFGDVLIGRPVDRHAEVVAVLGLELRP